MSVDYVREVAMSLPNATEQIQWENHLIFKIGGKIFALTTLVPEGVRLSVKSTPERFAELTEIPGMIPAPYMARNHWVALERWDAMRRSEMEELIRESYRLVFEKLPKNVQAQLSAKAAAKTTSAKKKAVARESSVKKKAAAK